MSIPMKPKIYHIVHIDRLPSIIGDSHLWCDIEITKRAPLGTTIGIDKIKQRRINELTLTSHPDLYVGARVPFYFCPRSVMLYLIYQRNHQALTYRGGQKPIIHLQADLYDTVAWAEQNQHRWAFTLSNAGSYYFEDRADLKQLHEIDWHSVNATYWQNRQNEKQSEFLIEHSFPWHLIERIGVHSQPIYQQVVEGLVNSEHKPKIEIRADWYY